MWISKKKTDDDELSYFFLPVNAPENESVRSESCWKLESDLLMNDVDVFSAIELMK